MMNNNTFEEKLLETTLNQIKEVSGNIAWLFANCENLNYRQFEKLCDATRLLQHTDFTRSYTDK